MKKYVLLVVTLIVIVAIASAIVTVSTPVTWSYVADYSSPAGATIHEPGMIVGGHLWPFQQPGCPDKTGWMPDVCQTTVIK